MAHALVSQRKAQVLSFALFLIGIGILFFIESWWPGIVLVVGIPMALKQYLLGRKWDMAISLFVFIGIFVTVQFDIPWKLLLPILFVIGGFYLFLKEFFIKPPMSESEYEEDVQHEIDEDQK